MNSFLRSAVLGSFLRNGVTLSSYSQNAGSDVPPVIDVHVHAMVESFPGGGPMCPNTSDFLASDPERKKEYSAGPQERCTPKLYPSAKGEYLKDIVSEMKRLNVTAVVFGDPASVQKWKEARRPSDPGTSFNEAEARRARRVDDLRKTSPAADSK